MIHEDLSDGPDLSASIPVNKEEHNSSHATNSQLCTLNSSRIRL